MAGVVDWFYIVGLIARELILFASTGFIIGGLSDLAIDLIWIVRTSWRSNTVYRRHTRAHAFTMRAARCPGHIAVFIPAWDESAVIAAMLNHATTSLGDADWRIYVGAYPNDRATMAAVESVRSMQIRLIVCDTPGPTTKADCLNRLWRALLADEAREGRKVKAIVLHDAEDVIHSAELRLFDRLSERFDLVQLPVLPLVDARSRWVGGHYNDEFAEHHGKTIVVREAIGAGIPSAGVGCAIGREMLGRIANLRGGLPFDQDSLTEDYELGLRISELGGRGIFVRLPRDAGRAVVAVRAHFPATLEAAIRQKSRWIAGIALSGWDRLGWKGGWAETWMRLHDRRAVLAALVLLAAYLGGLLSLGLLAYDWLLGADGHYPMSSPLLDALLWMSAVLLMWRLLMRFVFVSQAYGLAEGLRAIPRTVVGNIIAMIAARRAVGIYLRMRRDGIVRWDKTDHAFPISVGAE